MIPLRRKLVGTNLLILFIAIVAFGATTYRGLVGLSKSFSDLNIGRFESVKQSYQTISNENIGKIRAIYTDALKNKGKQLVEKDSASLAPMIADNAFLGVQQFLQKTFEDDHDIILASYFNIDQEDIRAWYFASSNLNKTLVFPITYNRSKKGWEGKTKQGALVFVSDPEVLNLVHLNQADVRFRSITLHGQEVQGFECMIPFVNGKSGPAVQKARAKGEAIGFLRYFLSPDEMNKSIAAEKENFESKLKSLASENQVALKMSQDIGRDASRRLLFILGIVTLLITVSGYFASFFSAIHISNPVKALTHIAEQMAKGDYVQTISVRSTDEIGILASAFQAMSNAIQKRDAELAEINRNLEKTVELRTQQLKDENRKISALLNNMKQAVFAVSADRKVVSPVSKFSETVFKQPIEGKTVFEFLYKQVANNSEEMSRINSGLLSVYGEKQLQWFLMENNFPRRLEFKGTSGEVNQVLQINYSPLFDDKDGLDKIMMVVEDVTEFEKLAREIHTQRENTEVLQQLARNDLEAIKGFFNSSVRMLCEINEAVRTGNLNSSKLEMVLRHLHTIKGNSSTLDLLRLSKVTHEVETNIHELRKYLTPEYQKKIIPENELAPLRDGLITIRKQLDDYFTIASTTFGLENELQSQMYLKLHKQIEELGWWSTSPARLQNLIRNVVEISDEMGLTDLSATLTLFKTSAEEYKNSQLINDAWLEVVFRAILTLYRSSGFVQHSSLSSVWVGLGLKLWDVSVALENSKGIKVETNKSTKTPISPKIAAVFESLENAWSYSSAHSMFFYSGYLRHLDSLVRDGQLESVAAIEAELWKQYFLAAKLQMDRKLTHKDRKDLKFLLKELAETPSDKGLIALKSNTEGVWIIHLMNALRRRKVSLQEFLSRWSEHMGVSESCFRDKVTQVEDSWEGLGLNILDVVLEIKTEELIAKSRNEVVELAEREFFLAGGNTYLKWIDCCQMLSGVLDNPELLKKRYKTVEVLTFGLAQLNDVINTTLEIQPLPAPAHNTIRKAVDRLMEIPIKPSLWNYQKMVDSMAKGLGKKLYYGVKGEDVTISRHMLYALQDGIVHLLRNMVDHGIESPEERQKTKKPEFGHIQVECTNESNELRILLKDDGRGMEPDAILNIAISKGLIDRDKASGMTSEDKLDLLFIPGFSTRDSITELSGRGVGMDAARKTIETLGGKLVVHSEVNIGTSFEIRIPQRYDSGENAA